MNPSSSAFIGRVCDLLGLPCQNGSHTRDDFPVALHEITGENQKRFAEWMRGHRSGGMQFSELSELIAAVRLADEEQEMPYHIDTLLLVRPPQ